MPKKSDSKKFKYHIKLGGTDFPVYGEKVGEYLAIRFELGQEWQIDHILTGYKITSCKNRDDAHFIAWELSQFCGENLKTNNFEKVKSFFVKEGLADYLRFCFSNPEIPTLKRYLNFIRK